jgi:hypothetical protein
MSHLTTYLTLFLSLLLTLSYGQRKPEVMLLAEHNIEQVQIRAYQYRADSVVNKTFRTQDIGPNGNTYKTSNFNGKDSLISVYDSKCSLDGTTRFHEDNWGSKESKIYYVYFDDYENNIHHTTHKNWSNDTLIHERKYLNRFYKDSVLFRKHEGTYRLQILWKYSSNGLLISKFEYDFLTGSKEDSTLYFYQENNGCIVTLNENQVPTGKSCTDGNKDTKIFYKTNTGWRSFIKIKMEKRGRKVTTYNKLGLIDKEEYFSAGRKLTALFEYKYLK